MKELNIESLLEIEGGASITGTLINSISTIVKTVTDLGRSFGSALRRITSKNVCPLR